MKSLAARRAGYVLFSLMLFMGCSNPADEGNGNPDVVGSNVVQITDNITAVTTWSGDSIYVIRKWDFYVENTLTIRPGTVIKFHPDGPYMMLGGSGTVNAQGTIDSPVVFTSMKDDAHGADNNGDGAATVPAAEDWYFVNMNGTNGSIFSHCHFYYGGNGSSGYVFSIEAGSAATVTNCVFAHNGGVEGESYGALNAMGATNGTIINNNAFFDNLRPLSISTAFNLNNSNVFHNPDSAAQTNTCNGIYVYDYDQRTTLQWQETEVPYVIDDNDWWIDGTLSLGDSVVLKFRPGSEMVLDQGASALSMGTGVYFTSYKDDAHGGDTNGDGAATSPAINDWTGIYDDSMAIPSPYYFTWSNILYDSY
ncbi:MAG: hypothetical protein JW699_06575 [Chitinispirillaceae bacterium]|nr:hypothetical protein [Chitinispirillaceae bacterium]